MLSTFAALKIFAPAGDSIETVVATNPPSAAVTNEIAGSAKEAEKPSVTATVTNANTVINDGVLATRQTPKSPIGGKQTLAAALPGEKQTEKNQIKITDNSNLNRVIAVRKGRVINMTPNATSSTSPNNAEQSGKISLGDVLSAIGIEVEFVGANCKVKSVRESTAARIANFQPGDLIEAIDGKKLSSEMTFSEKFTGKIFNVVRDGKQIVIDLTKR
jgi:hypothetical protein